MLVHFAGFYARGLRSRLAIFKNTRVRAALPLRGKRDAVRSGEEIAERFLKIPADKIVEESGKPELRLIHLSLDSDLQPCSNRESSFPHGLSFPQL
jgi:hypothetical protein